MLADLGNVGVAFEISLLSYIEAEMLRYLKVLPVMAAIFHLPLTPTLKSVHTSSAVLTDLENMGVAFVI